MAALGFLFDGVRAIRDSVDGSNSPRRAHLLLYGPALCRPHSLNAAAGRPEQLAAQTAARAYDKNARAELAVRAAPANPPLHDILEPLQGRPFLRAAAELAVDAARRRPAARE